MAWQVTHKKELQMKDKETRFDPSFRDDVFDSQALQFFLLFPLDSPPNDSIWVETTSTRQENVFGREYKHESPRRVKAILKKSNLIDYHVLSDHAGNPIPKDDPAYDVIFPPKAWMSDTAAERSMMFAAAKEARGKILVGGLGLAIYPQLVFRLNRSVDSMTIVEINPEVIQVVGEIWKYGLDKTQSGKINIVAADIESYLHDTSDCFDTIYLDTWEDADARFLPHVNHLIQLALPISAPEGQIHCWGYAMMVDTFVRDALMYAEKEFDLQPFHLDPALQQYADWLSEHQDAEPETPETIRAVARQIALTVAKSGKEYDRESCFTPYAESMARFYMNMARTRKE
jgi:hypothetical protein